MMNVFNFPILNSLLPIILVWELVWKAIALWKSARKGHKIWFVAILILNTVGILPIIYIVFFHKKKAVVAKKTSKKKKR